MAKNRQEDALQAFFSKVYGWMFFGLAVSGIIAYLTASSSTLMDIVLGNRIIFFFIIIVELGLVFSLVGLVKRMSSGTAKMLFILYAVCTGLTLSVIFLAFTAGSIALTFFVTAVTFGFMSAYGYTTKNDLSSWGSLLFMALIGIIIASLVNLFLQNSAFDYTLAFIGVLVFTGLAAYDTQKIKNIYADGGNTEEARTKESIIGALILYLDFVNLFLDLLRFFGRKK